jgi:arsenite methyltransferase
MTEAIEARYGDLAESSCCLSCGTASSLCEPTPGQVCVDLGCGRGTDVLRMAEKVAPDGHAYGIDLTDAMLQKARSTARKLGVTNATFLLGEIETIALPDASADWVTSNCVLNHVADKARAWREIARILKPSGRFVVSDIYAVEPIAPEDRADPEAVAECWAGAVTREEYLAHVAAAGFGDVTVLEESAPYRKGRAVVASFTLAGGRALPKKRCCG